MLPFSLAELKQTEQSCPLDLLLESSGFPEPLLEENKLEAERWRLQYIDSLLRTDVLDFETILNVKAIQFTPHML